METSPQATTDVAPQSLPDATPLTPLMKQYTDLKATVPDALLLAQPPSGGFQRGGGGKEGIAFKPTTLSLS